MPFERPSLTDLNEAALADFETRLPGVDARLRRSVLNVLARIEAAGLHGLYGYLDWMSQQVMPDTAEAEFLDRWATIWGLARKAPSVAAGLVAFTGTSGTIVPAGTLVQRSDGRSYATASDIVLIVGTGTASVTDTAPGLAGNAAAGSRLVLTSPVVGVQSTALIGVGGITGGADDEADAALLARLLARIRQAPHGGAAADYVAWGLEVPGVTRVWVRPSWMGLGTVGVLFVTDNDPAGIIPGPAKAAEVQAYIDAPSRRPVTADVFVIAPTPKALNLTITGLSPASAVVKAAIVAELADLLRREAEPGQPVLVSHIREAISTAAGEIDHALTDPSADVTCAVHELIVPGAITWA